MREERIREGKAPFPGRLIYGEFDEGIESAIYSVEGNDRFVVKNVRIPDLKTESDDTEKAKGYAREKLGKSLQLLKESHVDAFLPKTAVVLGESSRTMPVIPSIYVVQERIEGQSFDRDALRREIDQFARNEREVIAKNLDSKVPISYPYQQIVEQLDILVDRSLRLWKASSKTSKKDSLPLCLTLDKEERHPREGEGIIPELTNYKNIIIRHPKKSTGANRLFLVDAGLLAIHEDTFYTNPEIPGFPIPATDFFQKGPTLKPMLGNRNAEFRSRLWNLTAESILGNLRDEVEQILRYWHGHEKDIKQLLKWYNQDHLLGRSGATLKRITEEIKKNKS
jgi:hypothetical protein